MAKVRIINPTNNKTKESEVPDAELGAYSEGMSKRGYVVVDMASGNVLTTMPQPYSAPGAAWEGFKTGLSAGVPLIGDQEARKAEAEVERQQPEAYVGGKMVGEIGRDVAAALGLTAIRAPSGVVKAAPFAAAALQGAAEEGDTPQERALGAAKGLGGAVVGEAIGKGAGALVRAPLRAVGSALSDYVGKRIPGLELPSVPAPEVPPTATEQLGTALGEYSAAKGSMRRAGALDTELVAAEMKEIASNDAKIEALVSEASAAGITALPPDAAALIQTNNARRARVRQKLEAAGFEKDYVDQMMSSGADVDRLALGKEVFEADAREAARDAAAAAKAQVVPAIGEQAGPAALRAGVAGAADYLGPPQRGRRQVQQGARYGTPDWSTQLAAAGVSPEIISEIEANIARMPGEGPGGVSPLLRLQRPVIPTDEQLAGLPPDAQQQLARGALQSLGEYYNRTKDAAVVPEMQRLGKFVGGM